MITVGRRVKRYVRNVSSRVQAAARARAAALARSAPQRRGDAGHGAENGDVLFTSKRHDVACCSVRLAPSAARALPADLFLPSSTCSR